MQALNGIPEKIEIIRNNHISWSLVYIFESYGTPETAQ